MFIGFFCRNFNEYDKSGYFSHQGTCVNATHMAKVLQKNGIPSNVFHVWKIDDVRKILWKQDTIPSGKITHVVLQAIWITGSELVTLLNEFPDKKFVIRNHSQVGFLVINPRDFNSIREYFEIQDIFLNFTMSANNKRVCNYFTTIHNAECKYLPNLYDYERPNLLIGNQLIGNQLVGPLRIGCFGALRLLKNHTTQFAAAQLLSRKLGVNLEFYINGGRVEHGGGVLQSLRNMTKGLPWVKLIEVPWQNWSAFRKIIGHMHLCMQVSHTETFNIITADAISEGVCSVVSQAIEWTPSWWEANPDDSDEISRIGMNLLHDPAAIREGMENLVHYVEDGVSIWKSFIS